MGSNSDTFSTSALSNGQRVSCLLTSSISCFSGTPVSSDSITISVNPTDSFTAVVTQTKGYNPFCSGDTVTFTAAAVPGTNAVYHWKVDGADAETNSPEFTSSSLLEGQVISCTINAVPLCGNSINIGTPGGYNDTHSTAGAAYPTWYGNGHQQYLVLASELQGMGLSGGVIKRLGFVTGANVGNPDTLKSYTIKLATVPQAFLTSTMLTPAFTTVFGPADYRPDINNTNYHDFINPFLWDGSNNLLVDICFTSGVYGNGSYESIISNTGFVSGTVYQRDYYIPSPCDTARSSFTTSQRPYMIFSNSSTKDVSSNSITLQHLKPTYHFTGNGNWNIPSNWENSIVPPKHVLHCAEIIIDPVAGGECILNTSQVVAPGAKITVVAGKKFRVMGNVLVQE